MFFLSWPQLFGKKRPARARGGHDRHFHRPRLEPLEDRLAPAVWDGMPDTGGPSPNHLWSTGVNWVGDVAPLPDDNFFFPAGAARLTNFNDLAPNFPIISVTFSGSGYSITGNALTLSGSILVDQTVGTGTDTFNLGLNTVGGQTQSIIVFNSGVTLVLGGVISGTSALDKSGSGTLLLSGTNNFAGRLSVTQGILNVQNNSALGSTLADTSVFRAGTLQLQGSLTIAGETLNLDEGGGATGNGVLESVGGNNAWVGPIALQSSIANAGIGVDAGQLTLTNIISGSQGINKLGPGTLILTANNTYGGTTDVGAGTMLINGLQATNTVNVRGGATLGGTGTVGSILADTANVSPGISPGILTANTVNLTNSSLIIELNGTTAGTTYDQLVANGSLNLSNSSLQTLLGFASSVGDTFIIIPNNGRLPVVGTFNNLTPGATFTPAGAPAGQLFQISYAGGAAGTSVVLTHINAPPTVTPPANQTATEGVSASFTLGSFTDPDPGDNPWAVSVNWGDNTTTTTFTTNTAGSLGAQPHTYGDNATFTVTVTVTDKNGGSGSATFLVSVANTAPVLTNVRVTSPIPQGTAATLSGNIVDPSPLDTFTLTVNWGDGSANQNFFFGPGTTSFSVVHGYTQENSFTINLTLTDDDGGSASASASVTVCGFVTALYNDVLGRKADAAGLAFWQQQLGSGVSRTQVAADFWVSPEHRGVQVNFFYSTLLKRSPDPAGGAFWVNTLLAGVSEADVVIGFVTSTEYAAAHPTSTLYIIGLYQDVLGRTGTSAAGAAELLFWQRVLDLGLRSRTDVAFYFLSSDESFGEAIDDNYHTYLRRSPSSAEVQFWLNQILAGTQTPLSFATAFLGSNEYFQFTQANCVGG